MNIIVVIADTFRYDNIFPLGREPWADRTWKPLPGKASA